MFDGIEWARSVAVIVLCATAVAIDLRTRRIPNVLTFGAALLALAFHGLAAGVQGALVSIVGWLIGAALFYPFFALGGMGAGDVKLLAAVGAWLGPAAALWTGIYGSIAGGALAVLVAVRHRYLGTAVSNLGLLMASWRVSGVRSVSRLTLEHGQGPRLAYALAISIGAMVTLWLR